MKGVMLELRGAKLGVEVSANLALISQPLCPRSCSGLNVIAPLGVQGAPEQGVMPRAQLGASGTLIVAIAEASWGDLGP